MRVQILSNYIYQQSLVSGTGYGDMPLKDLMGSISRVGYCIPVPDFYLVLHGLRFRKSNNIMG